MERSITPLRAAIYLRTASAQTDDAVSLEVQRKRCHAYAQEHGYVVVATFEDAGRSGATLNRRGVKELRELAQARAIDMVIVTGADGLARSAADLAQLVAELGKAGVAIEAVNETEGADTQASAIMQHLESAFAQFEREHLVQRMVNGKRLSPQPSALRPQPSSPPLRVAIYARAAAHASVTSQLSTLRTAAEAAGWSVARVIVDRSAGGSLERQELHALRDAARAGAVDAVLVVSLDRLARRVRDLAALREELAHAGCEIVVLAQDMSRVTPTDVTTSGADEAAA